MSLEEEKYFVNEYYTYNILFFKLIGISPYKTSPCQMIHICFFNLIIVVASSSQVSVLILSELKIDTVTKLLETALPSFIFALTYYNFLSKVKIIKAILFRIKSDWNNMTNKTELMILKTYANPSRMCTILIAIAFYVYITILMLPSVIHIILYIFGVLDETELILPISIDYFLKDQMNFYFALFNEYTSLVVLSTIGIAHCSIFVSFIQHTCALFNIVAWKIEKGCKSNSHNLYHTYNFINYDEEYEWIIDVIESYDNVIDFVDLVKLYHGKICLFEAIFAMLLIILNYIYLFQILSFTINMNEVLQKTNYVFGSMFVIYIYHYLGQKLINHHTEIYIKLCQIPFYKLSLKTQKILLFMIMKSMMPCNLSVKGVIVLSHYLFGTFMKTSFSYAMIFYSSM
ncbi:uncharacterized protein LOC124957316 [Vespa velutina]|uniref:uncharacterized protein LOC124957316 n=1 Tax=Vespa velutina TaxID=202808 RepID=UPI001FB566A4|nr:uncharacterized protein LOC124957316 [Vespa velutina]